MRSCYHFTSDTATARIAHRSDEKGRPVRPLSPWVFHYTILNTSPFADQNRYRWRWGHDHASPLEHYRVQRWRTFSIFIIDIRHPSKTPPQTSMRKLPTPPF